MAALEAEVADLKRCQPRGHNDWIKDVIGKVTDLELFEELLRLGREYRDSDREPDPGKNQP